MPLLGPCPARTLPLAADGERTTAAWLERLVEIKADADFVLVDLPPNLGAATVAALSIPVSPPVSTTSP